MLDPSIILGIKTPPQQSPMATISSFLDMQKTQQAIQAGQIANQMNQANLDDATRQRAAIANAPTNPDGTVDQNAVQQTLLRNGGLTGAAQATSFANADSANTQASRAHFQLEGEQAKVGLEAAQGALGDPRIMGTPKTNPDGSAKTNPDGSVAMTPPDPTQAVTALAERENEMVQRGVPVAKAKMLIGPFYAVAAHNPAALPQLLTNSVKAGIGAQAQLAANTQNQTFVPTEGGTQPYGTNANAPGGLGPIGNPIAPPNDIAGLPSGGSGLVNRATKKASNFDTSGDGPMVNPPPGETLDTQRDLQAQRMDALKVVQAAPAMHQINNAIHDLASSGVATGQGGQFWRDLQSKGGYTAFGSTESQKFNELGKYLERSSLQAAQSMGPGTNAGLAASVAANGSTAYDPKTIAKIADLNESLLRGAEGYQQGLEMAINNPANKSGVFAKRQFDQQWAANFDPRMMALVAAKERGDLPAANAIINSVGGPDSRGAIDFQTRMQAVHRLMTTGSR
jgi:hypothetical protein